MKLLLLRIRKLLLILKSPFLLHRLFFYGVFAGVEHKPILTKDLLTIVDIGANKGQFSLASRFFSPKARIFAFEPLDAPGNVFNKVFFHDSCTSLFPFAVGSKSQKLDFHISSHEDSSSLLPIGPNQILHFPGTAEKDVIEINVNPLSFFLDPTDIKPPSMLKIDVQGYELEVLKGCESLIKYFDSIYCECSFIELYDGQSLAYEIINWLSDHNFVIDGIFNVCYDDNRLVIQADFLFKKLNKIF